MVSVESRFLDLCTLNCVNVSLQLFFGIVHDQYELALFIGKF